ncbi:hypothetical protein HRbin06_00989 [archaeon HR06]|nr:hypothetical protein HRbin06_00989 [archaeon HR06]
MTFLHFFLIPLTKGYAFDENYYIPAGLDLLKGKFSNLEHPFLGKLWVSLGVLIFGNSPLGWRFFYAIIGILTLLVYWKISKELLDESKAFFALTLLSLENMFFIHSNLALLDIPSIFFSLLALLSVLKKKYLLVGIFLGLALLNKESALLFLFIILSFLLRRKTHSLKILLILVITFLTFIIPLTFYDQIYKPRFIFQGKEWIINNALDHVYFIYVYSSTLTMDLLKEPNKGNFAWNWIIPSLEPFEPMGYYYEEVKEDNKIIAYISWVGMGNLPIWWSFWFSFPFSLYNVIFKKGKDMDYLTLSWISLSYFPFLYLSYFANRIVYPFYFLNTIPILTLALPYYMSSLLKDDLKFHLFMSIYSIFALFFFLYYFPYKIVI